MATHWLRRMTSGVGRVRPRRRRAATLRRRRAVCQRAGSPSADPGGGVAVEHVVEGFEQDDEGDGEEDEDEAHEPGLTGGKSGADEGEFGDEDAEGGQADDGEDADGEEAAGERHGFEQAGDGGDFGGVVAVEDAPGEEEEHGFGEAVVEQVEEGGKDAQGAEGQADAGEGGVFDAGVGQQALVVFGEHHAEGGDDEGEDAEAEEQVVGIAGSEGGVDDDFPAQDGV